MLGEDFLPIVVEYIGTIVSVFIQNPPTTGMGFKDILITLVVILFIAAEWKMRDSFSFFLLYWINICFVYIYM